MDFLDNSPNATFLLAKKVDYRVVNRGQFVVITNPFYDLFLRFQNFPFLYAAQTISLTTL